MYEVDVDKATELYLELARAAYNREPQAAFAFTTIADVPPEVMSAVFAQLKGSYASPCYFVRYLLDIAITHAGFGDIGELFDLLIQFNHSAEHSVTEHRAPFTVIDVQGLLSPNRLAYMTWPPVHSIVTFPFAFGLYDHTRGDSAAHLVPLNSYADKARYGDYANALLEANLRLRVTLAQDGELEPIRDLMTELESRPTARLAKRTMRRIGLTRRMVESLCAGRDTAPLKPIV